jgi:hypothetical protein
VARCFFTEAMVELRAALALIAVGIGGVIVCPFRSL